MGGELVAIDVLECPRRGPLVCEINHSMEFRNSVEPTGVNIPAHVVEYALSLTPQTAEEPAPC